MKKWLVITNAGAGIDVFESDSKRECNAYLRQAHRKGSPVGFLAVIASKTFIKNFGGAHDGKN